MEENNIINNEEVTNITEEIVEAASNGGFKTAATLGLGMIVGAAAYKYVLKPAGAKFKSWHENRKAKKQEIVDGECEEVDDFEDDYDEEE